MDSQQLEQIVTEIANRPPPPPSSGRGPPGRELGGPPGRGPPPPFNMPTEERQPHQKEEEEQQKEGPSKLFVNTLLKQRLEKRLLKHPENDDKKKNLKINEILEMQDLIINTEKQNKTQTNADENIIYISINIPLNKRSILLDIGEFFDTNTDDNNNNILNKIFEFQNKNSSDTSSSINNATIDYSFWFNDNELYTLDQVDMQNLFNELSNFLNKSNEFINKTNITYNIKKKHRKETFSEYEEGETLVGGSINYEYIKIKLPFQTINNNSDIDINTLKEYEANNEAKKIIITEIIKKKIISNINNKNDLLNYIIDNKVEGNNYTMLFNIIKTYYDVNKDKIKFVFEDSIGDDLCTLSILTIRLFLIMNYKEKIIKENKKFNYDSTHYTDFFERFKKELE